jgi:hypothetical protein
LSAQQGGEEAQQSKGMAQHTGSPTRSGRWLLIFSDVELDPLGQGQIGAPVNGDRLAAHVSFP